METGTLVDYDHPGLSAALDVLLGEVMTLRQQVERQALPLSTGASCTVAQVAERLRVSPPTVYEALRNGGLDGTRLHGRWLVALDSVERYLERRALRERRITSRRGVPQGYLPLREAAAVWGLPYDAARRVLRQGRVRYVRGDGPWGGAYYVSRSDAERYDPRADRRPPHSAASRRPSPDHLTLQEVAALAGETVSCVRASIYRHRLEAERGAGGPWGGSYYVRLSAAEAYAARERRRGRLPRSAK